MFKLLGLLIGGFCFLFLVAAVIYLKATVINEAKIDQQLTKLNQISIPQYDNFTIKNPYAKSGIYHKAQLHTHSTNSDGQFSPEELISRYQELDYTFLAFTDHDKITGVDVSTDDLIVISGEEMTYPRPFWPFGPHLGRLFVTESVTGNMQARINKTVQAGGVVVIHHPSCTNNLGTQQWLPQELAELDDFYLMEISNVYTSTSDNNRYWHGLLKKFGPERPVWGLGGDDTHKESQIDKNFIRVKVNDEIGRAHV